MKILDITDSISIESKSNLDTIFKTYKKSRSLECKGLTCIDLKNLTKFKNKKMLGNHQYLLLYSFHQLEDNERFFIATPLLKNQTMYSFAKYWSNLDAFEKEISCSFGVKFFKEERIQKEILDRPEVAFMNKDFILTDSHENFLKLYESNIEAFELKLNFRDYNILSQRGNFKIKYEGNQILNIEPHFSSVQRLEKVFEQSSLENIKNLIPHINSRSWIPYQILWTETLEFLSGHNISFYESLKRSLFLEISRLLENIDSLTNIFKILNEDILCEVLGERYKVLKRLVNTIDCESPFSKISSFSHYSQLDEEYTNKIISYSTDLASLFEDLEQTVIKISDIYRKTQEKDECLNPVKYGLTGVGLAAEGINSQIRSQESFYSYDELDVESFLGIDGNTFDRILIRFHDGLQSISNIVRITESMPVYNEAQGVVPEIEIESDRIIFSYTESTSGEIGFVLALSENGSIERLNVLTPSMRMLSYFLDSHTTLSVDNIMLTWAGLGLNFEEVVK